MGVRWVASLWENMGVWERGDGVNLRVIQRHLGHSSLETTMVYLHLTHKGTEDAYALIDSVMEDL